MANKTTTIKASEKTAQVLKIMKELKEIRKENTILKFKNNELTKQLNLCDVSQQSKLLIAYRTMIEFDIKHHDFEESVDYFLKNKESYL